jgi:O-antigen/teichoic acid export membrane protein
VANHERLRTDQRADFRNNSKILATRNVTLKRARLLHTQDDNAFLRRETRDLVTVAESTFRNPKLHRAVLIAYKASADLAGKGSLFLITIVAARRLSPQAFGIFSLGSAFGWLIAVATDCGIQLHLARAVSRAPADAARLLAAWLRIRLWTAGIALVVVAVGLMAWRWPVGYAVPIAIFALMYACSSLIEFLYYFYRGMSRSDIESSLTLWQRGGTLVCGLAALAWRPDVTVLALAMLAPIIVALLVSLRISLRLAPVASADAVPDDDCAGVFRRDVWPIGAGIVLSALYFRIDVFLVQLWSGTTSVALYNSVFRLVEALRLVPAAVLAVVLPTLCRAHDLRPVLRTCAWLGAFAAIATAALWSAAGWLIPLVYGARYAPAIPAFRVLLLAFPLMSINYALTHQLIGWDGQRSYAVACLTALVVNVAMNARLIPAWSIEGAAWSTLGTEAFLTLACAAILLTRRAPLALLRRDDEVMA